MRFMVTFKDEFEASSEEECYDQLIRYLNSCFINRDVSAFEFEKLEEVEE